MSREYKRTLKYYSLNARRDWMIIIFYLERVKFQPRRERARKGKLFLRFRADRDFHKNKGTRNRASARARYIVRDYANRQLCGK